MSYNRAMSTIGPVILTAKDFEFLETLWACLCEHRPMIADAADTQGIFEQSGLPKEFWGFALTVYQPGKQRLMVVRAASVPAIENARQTMKRLLAHPRVGEFDFGDRQRCRVQVDFIVDEPKPLELGALSQSALDASRFEMGIDGLRISGPNPKRCRYLLPGDAFVWSILSLGQLRKHIRTAVSENADRPITVLPVPLGQLREHGGWLDPAGSRLSGRHPGDQRILAPCRRGRRPVDRQEPAARRAVPVLLRRGDRFAPRSRASHAEPGDGPLFYYISSGIAAA